MNESLYVIQHVGSAALAHCVPADPPHDVSYSDQRALKSSPPSTALCLPAPFIEMYSLVSKKVMCIIT